MRKLHPPNLGLADDQLQNLHAGMRSEFYITASARECKEVDLIEVVMILPPLFATPDVLPQSPAI